MVQVFVGIFAPEVLQVVVVVEVVCLYLFGLEMAH